MATTGAGPARKVVVIGWDGANFDLAQRWADEGLLPNLARVRAAGAHGTLRSTMPPISAPAWASFATGNNPGRHGIYYFKEHVSGTYDSRLVCGADRRSATLWEMLNRQGRKAGIVNLPMTYPPAPLDGFLVAGIDTPGDDSSYTYPPALKDEMLGRLGHYHVELSLLEESRTARYDKVWEKISANLENRIEAVRYLFNEKEWDFFAVNFRATDSVQHHFWKFFDPSHPQHDPALAGSYGDAMLRVYRRLDEYLGEVMEHLPADASLIVMSDHGFGPVSDKVIYLNNWLAQGGWLTFRQETRPAGGPIQRVRSLLWQGLWPRLRKAMPQVLKDLAERLAPALYKRVRDPAAYYFIDWARTRAYADEYQESIWINLAGREPAGIVQPGAEYEALRDELLQGLRDLKDPLTGLPAIELAGRREEIYHGTEVERAPDIVLLARQEPFFRVRPSHTSPSPEPVQTMSAAELQADFMPNGQHRMDGMFYAAGPGIAAGRRLKGAQIVDVAPTVLQLTGCQVPRGLDGRVLTELFESEPSVSYYDVESPAQGDFAGGYEDSEIDEVSDRLRGLGYLG